MSRKRWMSTKKPERGIVDLRLWKGRMSEENHYNHLHGLSLGRDVEVDVDVDEEEDDDGEDGGFYDKLVRKTERSLPEGPQTTNENENANKIIEGGLKMPTSMMYTEEGSYDNIPFLKQRQEAGTLDRGRKGQASLRVRVGDGKVGDKDMKAGKAKKLFLEKVVHESELRKAFLAGNTIEDADRGQKCKHCSTCPGFEEHYWRKLCKWCRCPRHLHRIGDDIKKIDLSRSVVSQNEGLNKLNQKYVWVPVGVDNELVELYFQQLPQECVPLKGSKGEQWRKKQLQIQCPSWDTNWEKCDQLTQSEIDEFKLFDQLRMREAFDIGDVVRCPDFSRPESCNECFLKEDGTHWPYCSRFVPITNDNVSEPSMSSFPKQHRSSNQHLLSPDDMPDIKMMKKKKRTSSPRPEVEKKKDYKSKLSGGMCSGCSLPLMIDEVVVQIERLDSDASFFHPQCVVCSECQMLLVDLRCYVDIGFEERDNPGAEKRLFCGRHWGDNKKPRCCACDETIHQKQHVFELDKPYHFRHFSCYICDANLTEMATYVPRDEKPLCLACYQEHLADKCSACSGPIDATRGGGGKITVGKYHWHPNCFTCRTCKTTLKGKPCVPKGTRIYCKDCYKQILKK
eukprot:m.106069 g.106069  ORF g.106069 m.106069 type:complete len:623 (+) comp9146_c0_seq1:2-1870(+)